MARFQSFIYIGPSIPPIGLKKFTLYRTGELPLGLRTYAETKPVLRSLYVPTSQLAEAATKLDQKGTVEHAADAAMKEISKAILSR